MRHIFAIAARWRHGRVRANDAPPTSDRELRIGAEQRMDFAAALAILRTGGRIRRASWPASTWVALCDNWNGALKGHARRSLLEPIAYLVSVDDTGLARYAMWLPGIGDLLGEDWLVFCGDD